MVVVVRSVSQFSRRSLAPSRRFPTQTPFEATRSNAAAAADAITVDDRISCLNRRRAEEVTVTVVVFVVVFVVVSRIGVASGVQDDTATKRKTIVVGCVVVCTRDEREIERGAGILDWSFSAWSATYRDATIHITEYVLGMIIFNVLNNVVIH